MSEQTVFEKEQIEKIFVGFAIEAQKQIPASFEKNRKKVIVLAGPTACGKTEFAITLANAIGGEIVSADSMQVFRNMDLGTAKATPQQREIVPHHLIDIRDIHESFNVVDFYFEGRLACNQILERENVPIVTGGSGFYLHSLIYGPPSGPPSIPEVRKAIEDRMEQLGADHLFEELRQQDPQYAATITKKDKQKIVRALEIMTISGKKVSKLAWKNKKHPQTYDFRCWFLYRPKESIYKRIDQRCEQMLEQGFINEVDRLLTEGDILTNTSAAQAIGYRQAIEYLQSPRDKSDYEHFVKSFKQASRNYAKRQYTWFRREPLFRWVDMDLVAPDAIMKMIEEDYEAGL